VPVEYVLGCVFSAIGVAILLACGFFFLRSTLRARAARDWPQTSAVILKSTYVRAHARAPRVLSIRFAYSVEGREHTSERASFGDHGGAEGKRLWDKYTEGHLHLARYDPRNPALAVLEPGKPGTTPWFIAPSGLLLIFLGYKFIEIYAPLVRVGGAGVSG